MNGANRVRDQRGAALVEFALIVPILFAVLLGMVTSGLTYARKVSLDTAARDGSRYGATLPVSNYGGLTGSTGWLATVAGIAQQSATGDINAGVAGRSICVAYVYPNGATTNDETTMLVRTDTGDSYSTGSTCFTDGLPASSRRVQVELTRQSTIQAVLFSTDVTLVSDGLTRFEAVPAGG